MGWGYSGADSTKQKFTRKERDAESGLDYFLARYYSSAQGRFTSPDEFAGGPDELFDFADQSSDNPTFYADLHEPQSLNKYQYCYNNPLSYVDPDGHKSVLRMKRLGGASATGMLATAGTMVQSPDPTTAAMGFGLFALALIGDALINRHPAPVPSFPTQVQTQTQAQPMAPAAPIQMARPIDKPREGDGHRTNKRHPDKHTRPRSGDKKPPNFKPRVPKRPQDRPSKDEMLPASPAKEKDPKPKEEKVAPPGN